MKFWSLLSLIALLTVSCAGHQTGAPERDVASASVAECVIEKHQSKDWYRVSLYGKPYNDTWYSANKVQQLKNEIAAAGRCQ